MVKLYSALILLSMIWGTSFLFIKILLIELDPTAVVFGRCLFGAVILFILILFSKDKMNIKQLPWMKLFIVALMNNSLPWFLICSGEMKISSSLASIINATTPVWTLLIGFFLFSTSLRRNHWAGIAIGFLGIFILSEIKPGELFSGNTAGILLLSGASLCYGLGTQMSKKYLSHLTVLQISFFTLALSTIISFVMMLMVSPHSVTAFQNSKIIIPFLGLGALGSGIAYLLFYFLVKKGSAEFAALVTYLVPVSAIIWGAFILNETIHLSMLVGLMIIFTGVYITSRKPRFVNRKNFSALENE